MPKKRRKGPALLALCLTALLLGGCQPQSASSSAPAFSVPAELPQVGGFRAGLLLTMPQLASSGLEDVVRGVQDRCDELNVQLALHEGGEDVALQAEEIATFAANGGDAVLCQTRQPAALSAVLQDARAAGLLVVALGEALPEADWAFLTGDYDAGYLLGRLAGRWIEEEGAGSAAVGLLEYPGGAAAEAGRGAGIAAWFEETLPDIPLARAAVTGGDVAAALQALQRELPGLNVVLGADDALALAALDVLDEEGDGTGLENTFFGGIGAGEEALAAMEAGRPYRATVDLGGYKAGKALVDAVLASLEDGAAGRDMEMQPTAVTAPEDAGEEPSESGDSSDSTE